MQRSIQEVKFTKTSSKGQVVIPSKIRKKMKIQEGSILAVVAKNGMIVLKKIDSKLTDEDLKTLKGIEEAWEDIERGRYKVRSPEIFFEELKRW